MGIGEGRGDHLRRVVLLALLLLVALLLLLLLLLVAAGGGSLLAAAPLSSPVMWVRVALLLELPIMTAQAAGLCRCLLLQLLLVLGPPSSAMPLALPPLQVGVAAL